MLGHAGMAPRIRGIARTRGAPLAVAVLAVAMMGSPGVASAGTRALKGKIEGGGTVRFALKRNSEGERTIVRWRWRNLPLKCADGSHVQRGEFNPPWTPVVDRYFDETANLDEEGRKGFAKVHGSFPRTWNRAKGTFQVSGDTATWDDCETTVDGTPGPVTWRAKRI
jgi:hypothetical protein